MLPEGHFATLRKIVARIGDHPITWALTGSTSMALQGMPLEIHDIDIQTDKAGAYEIDRLLLDYAVVPVRFLPSKRIRSHFGEFEVDGIEVEVMGDMEKQLDDGSWEPPVRIEEYRGWVESEGLRIPVISLEHEVEAYAKMGRLEKSRLIRDWLKRNNHRIHRIH
ncbi:MAG: hypothetical protein AB9891_15385 [Anaerolineaceae bacterium]